MSEILKAEGLSLKNRFFTIFDGIGMHVEKGSVFCVRGERASGKTMLLRLLSGVASPTEGEVSFPEGDGVKPRIGLMLDGAGFYYGLTGRDQLEIKRLALGESRVNRTDELLEMFGLTSYANVKVKSYSLSMRAKLAVALTLIGDPEILMLDEPFRDMTAEDAQRTEQILVRENRENGRTIIYTTEKAGYLTGVTSGYLNLSGNSAQEYYPADTEDMSGSVIRIMAEPLDEVKKILNEMEIYSYQTKGVCLLYVFEQPERAEEIREKCIAAGIRVSECRAVKDTAVK